MCGETLFSYVLSDPERLFHHHPLLDEEPEYPRVLAVGLQPLPVPRVVHTWSPGHMDMRTP